MKKVSIVTVNFNSEKETHDLLASLQKVKQEGFSMQVVVVDNGSKQPFTPLQKEMTTNTTFLTSEKNLGFTGGYNLGIKKALGDGADYIVLLNNDTLVEKSCLTYLVQTADENPICGIVSPKIYFANGHEFHKERYKESERGKVFWYAGGFMDWENAFSRHRGVDEVDRGQYDKQETIDFASGCCIMLPRKVLEKVGMFDDKFYLYFEDADLSQRVIQAGYIIIYEPKAVIWHVNAASGGGAGSILHDYYLTRNRMLFGMRYAPFRTKLALIRESIRLLINGRMWQKKGIRDFYLGKFGKGSFNI